MSRPSNDARGGIVVVGGGFAGFWAALAARRVAPAEVHVSLVSRSHGLEIRPRLYEAEPQTLQVDMLPLLHGVGVGFTQAEALGIDHVSRALLLERGGAIRYSRLVVATGSALRRPPIPGAEQAFSIDTLAEAVAFDVRLASVVRRTTKPVVVVVGAGFTGIELALEMRDRIARHGKQDQAEDARIVIVDRAEVVGSQLGSGPRPVIEAALTEARVERRLGARVKTLGHGFVEFANGERMAADAVVLTTGMVAAEFVSNVPGEHDQLGRVVVDRYLRAPAAPSIFVAGDAAAVDGGDGHVVLQSCQHALQLGRFAGENAAWDLSGRPMLRYVQPPYITCLDLGRSGAVFTRGWQRSVERIGSDAKAIKKRINTRDIYPPEEATAEELLAMSTVDAAMQRRTTVRTG